MNISQKAASHVAASKKQDTPMIIAGSLATSGVIFFVFDRSLRQAFVNFAEDRPMADNERHSGDTTRIFEKFW